MHRLILIILLSLALFLSSPALAIEAIVGCPDIHRDLSLTNPPATGHDVTELQERLLQLGFNPGKVDGTFGSRTRQGVIDFQSNNNLPLTGIVTPAIWDKLAADALPIASLGEISTKPTGQISIVINTDQKKLTVYDDDRIHVTFPVAVGKYKTPTPTGEWRVVHKSTNWGGGFGSRWLGLNVPWGIYGIHGTNKPYSINTNASGGCIRMFNRDVEKLYPIIPMGTPVTIISDSYPKYPPGFKKRDLKKGMAGPDVIEMQMKLKQTGVFWGRADGRFGVGTEVFVKRYQALTGQEPTGEFSREDYDLLGKLITNIFPPKQPRNN